MGIHTFTSKYPHHGKTEENILDGDPPENIYELQIPVTPVAIYN